LDLLIVRRFPTRKPVRRHLLSHDVPQQGRSSAYRLSHRGFSARQPERSEVREPGEPLIARNEKFPAPNLAIQPVTGSIPRDAEHLAVDPMFRHTGSDVRMVMLHGNERHRQSSRQLAREDRRTIIGVPIAGNGLRCDLEQPLEIIHNLSKGQDGFHRRQITDVLAHHNAITAQHGYRVLEMPAHGKDRIARSSLTHILA